MGIILQTRNLNKHFGGVPALVDVNLSIKQNEIRCVIGPNGAGKSTLFKVLCCLIKPDAGTIEFKGEDITRISPSGRVRRGLGLAFQTISAYEQLSVRENLQIASRVHSMTQTKALIEEISDKLDFDMNRETRASELSHHELQWLEILMVIQNGATVGLLDEPTAGLAERETEMTADTIKICQKHGLTVLVVEHDLKFIKQIAETVTVMQQGGVFFEGSLQAVLDNEDVKNIYLGR